MNGLIERQFAKMGARVQMRPPDSSRRFRRAGQRVDPPAIRLDVVNDRRGECFDICVDESRAKIEILDVRPRQRHLLLMSRDLRSGAKEKFLCGHDERHWFVAAIPPGSASNVLGAMEALKPTGVRAEVARRGVRTKLRNRRRNPAFVRQGEWFFVPAGELVVSDLQVFRNEPLRRGSGKPHVVDFLVRRGGVTVYVSSRYPNGLTVEQYQALIKEQPGARSWGWQVMRRDAEVYVKGRVRHADHRTIVLDCWHRVLLNRETDAPAMEHVAFLD